MLGESVAPWTVEEVADRLGISPATARKHLDELVRDGVVVADAERTGRPGRPRLRYRVGTVASDAEAYQRLSQLLLAVVATGEEPEEIGRRLGLRTRTSSTPNAQPPDAERALLDAMSSDGFEPELADGPEGPVMTYHRCPYAAVAADNPAIVCALHRGFAVGLLGQWDGSGGPAVGRLEIRDPRLAGCQLHLRPTT